MRFRLSPEWRILIKGLNGGFVFTAGFGHNGGRAFAFGREFFRSENL